MDNINTFNPSHGRGLQDRCSMTLRDTLNLTYIKSYYKLSTAITIVFTQEERHSSKVASVVFVSMLMLKGLDSMLQLCSASRTDCDYFSGPALNVITSCFCSVSLLSPHWNKLRKLLIWIVASISHTSEAMCLMQIWDSSFGWALVRFLHSHLPSTMETTN